MLLDPTGPNKAKMTSLKNKSIFQMTYKVTKKWVVEWVKKYTIKNSGTDKEQIVQHVFQNGKHKMSYFGFAGSVKKVVQHLYTLENSSG